MSLDIEKRQQVLAQWQKIAEMQKISASENAAEIKKIENADYQTLRRIEMSNAGLLQLLESRQ